MNGFLTALAAIISRAIPVALVYVILKYVFHYTCNPFEVYVILMLNEIGVSIVHLFYSPTEE